MNTVVIPSGRNGPPDSGHGGYSAGLFASALKGSSPVRVRLHLPPPLAVALDVEVDSDSARFSSGGELIAEAWHGELGFANVPEIPSFQEAEEASQRSAFRTRDVKHPFPTCFGCGTRRPPGDGLQIWPGLTDQGDVAAATWDPSPWLDPYGRLPPELQWAALDCPGALGAMEQLGLTIGDEAWLLGTMTAHVSPGWEPISPVTVLGWLRAREGRKRTVGSALLTGQGDLVARAEAVWIRVDRPA